MPSLDYYKEEFSNSKKLNVRTQGDKSSPHKPCLLLAVIEWAEREKSSANKIVIYDQPSLVDPALVKIFQRYVNAVLPNNLAKIANPLLRLQKSSFWHLFPKPNREKCIGTIPRNGGDDSGFLRKNIDHIYLDKDLHGFLMKNYARQELRDCLIEAWFSGQRKEIKEAINLGQQMFKYEQQLDDPLGIEIPTYKDEVRKPVFRERVLAAYNYSCAATGDQFLMFDGSSLLEAAHILPRSERGKDRTTNGMALSPTYHRAMDRYLIVPGPDDRWHVSHTLDRRLSGHKQLIKLDREKILRPKKTKDFPDKDALEWRLNEFYEWENKRK